MAKGDVEVQRLAAHAVANLAVNGELGISGIDAMPNTLAYFCIFIADNRQNIVDEGGITPLISLMGSESVEVQRQSTKAIANLAVNGRLCRDLIQTAFLQNKTLRVFRS